MCKRWIWIGKHCRPWLDCSFMSCLICVYTVCSDLFVPLYRILIGFVNHKALLLPLQYRLSLSWGNPTGSHVSVGKTQTSAGTNCSWSFKGNGKQVHPYVFLVFKMRISLERKEFLKCILNRGQLIKERICFFGSKFFPLRIDLLLKVLSGKRRKSQNMFHLKKKKGW